MSESKKKNVQISMDPEVWEEFGRIADEMKMTKGALVELMTRLLAKAEKKPFGEVIEDMLRDMLKPGK